MKSLRIRDWRILRHGINDWLSQNHGWISLVTHFVSITATAIALIVLSSPIGCVHPTRKITKSRTTQTTELMPSVQDHTILAAGDEVMVSWEGAPVLVQPLFRQVA